MAELTCCYGRQPASRKARTITVRELAVGLTMIPASCSQGSVRTDAISPAVCRPFNEDAQGLEVVSAQIRNGLGGIDERCVHDALTQARSREATETHVPSALQSLPISATKEVLLWLSDDEPLATSDDEPFGVLAHRCGGNRGCQSPVVFRANL